MLGGTASLTLHKALLLSNHAWGAASASYLPAVSSLSDLKPGSNPWSVGCTPRAPGTLGRLRVPCGPQDSPPRLSCRSMGRGRVLSTLTLTKSREGTLEDSGAINCQSPSPLWLFLALSRRVHTPHAALLKEPKQPHAQWGLSLGEPGGVPSWGPNGGWWPERGGPDARRSGRI